MAKRGTISNKVWKSIPNAISDLKKKKKKKKKKKPRKVREFKIKTKKNFWSVM